MRVTVGVPGGIAASKFVEPLTLELAPTFLTLSTAIELPWMPMRSLADN
jgi:hypothetical protein